MQLSQDTIDNLASEEEAARTKKRRRQAWLSVMCVLAVLLVAEIAVFAYLVKAANDYEPDIPEHPEFDLSGISDKMAGTAPLSVVDEECYLDRNRDLHLLCRVISIGTQTEMPSPVGGADVWYKLYGDDTDEPWSVFSAYADENGYVDVIVDFPGLTPMTEDKVLGKVDNLVSYDVAAVNGVPQEHSPVQHKGEASFACGNWLTNSSWYKVDYRSWGSREMAAFHSGKSPDPEVRERFSWNTAPQRGPDANADGSANYWNGRNWILVHDYSWIGQVWLTMCPGMVYYIDGVEYEALGVFNQDRNNSISVVYDRIGSRDPLILQTCDGWVDVRIIYGYPVGFSQGGFGSGSESGSETDGDANAARS